MKKWVIPGISLVIVAFALGFVPQYMKAQRLLSDLSEAKQQLSACQLGSELSMLRDMASLMYLEATRKNYGIAGEYSTRFFNAAHQLAEQTPDASLRGTLQELLKSRDSITAYLAKGDPAVLPELQSVVLKTEQEVKR